MKNNFNIAIIMMAMLLMLLMQIDSENQIKDLKLEMNQQTDSLGYIIDSLNSEIDTLNFEIEIWDYNITNNTTHLLSAIIHVESSGRDSAYHRGEDAVGCLQIRKCMVDDVNRILRRQKSDTRFAYDDRWLRHKSIKMFDIYCKHYGLTTAEEIARCWNGGPRGMNNEMTAGYWRKVEKQIKENS